MASSAGLSSQNFVRGFKIGHSIPFSIGSNKFKQQSQGKLLAGPGTADTSELRITFVPDNVDAQGKPGAMLSQVAEDAGVFLSVGCREGQCGACEVEIRKGKDHEGMVVRSCVTPIPPQELISESDHWFVSTEFDFDNLW